MANKTFNRCRVTFYIFECPFNVAGRCQEERQGETQDWAADLAVGDLKHVLAPGVTGEGQQNHYRPLFSARGESVFGIEGQDVFQQDYQTKFMLFLIL